MSSHIVIDGNAFYEVDDICMQEKEREKLQKCSEKKKWEEKNKDGSSHDKEFYGKAIK